MAVFRWGQSWNALRDLEREVDQLLHGVIALHGIRLGRQYPPMNLYELPDEYLLTAELPGTRIEDLELTVAGGILTLRGRRQESEAVPGERFRRQERFRGAWQRSVSLPERIRDDEMRAELSSGILKIHLPKTEAPPIRAIPVVGGD